MFTKAFRVKSNTVIKGSDRRKLRVDISAAFPSLSVDDLNELVPNKEELNVVKIYAHKGDAVTLFVFHRNPLFFQLEKQLYPTVYTLWRYPDLLPAFTTWPQVVLKLTGGADLMLPGVVASSTGLPDVNQGDTCAVNVVSNRAPVAVGTAAMSSREMRTGGMKGKGVNVLHTYMDQLWAFGDKSIPPIISVTDPSVQAEADMDTGESGDEGTDEPAQESEGQNAESGPDAVESSLQDLSVRDGAKEDETGDVQGEQEDPRSLQEQMDSLLFQCFLHALKSKVKKSELPLLTGAFLRKHMASCCPKGRSLDIKKSSYKKLSKFLQSMQKEHSLVRVKELSKGVDSIVEVDWKNPELCSFCVPEDWEPREDCTEDIASCEVVYKPPEITSLYAVTARLEPLFQDARKKKGAVLQASEVRSIITDYVKRNELVHERNKSYVNISPVLCDCLLEKSEYQEVEVLKWDDLFSRTLSRMQSCHQLQFPGQAPVVRKGQVEPIDITVASRGSNKKIAPVPTDGPVPTTCEWVRVKTFRRMWNEPRWSSPLQVTARTSHCVRLQGKGDTWFHLSSCVPCDTHCRSLTATGVDLRTQVQEREATEETQTDSQQPQPHCKIVHKQGAIFSSPNTEPLAHCVSADCAYGAGIAVQFKQKYGTDKVVCQNKKPGQCAVTFETDGRTIFHLITKEKCTDLPTYETFTNSLKYMRDSCTDNQVHSVSVPRLGCGLDKLDFNKIQEILTEVFRDLSIIITVYSLP